MYKVLIVDDEKMIRMGMKRGIAWKSLEIDEIYTAASGKEALTILREQHPEIMITDIQMTEMTGLELIGESRKYVPELRVIVLTGFNNFEYARQSLRLQVQDFFLKPIEEKDLEQSVKKQIDYLEYIKNRERNKKLLERTQGSAQQNRLEHCMRHLIHSRKEKAVCLDLLDETYHFDINQQIRLALIVPALYMNQQPAEENFRAMSVKNICMGMVDSREMGITFTDNEGIIAIVFFENEDGESVMEKVQQLSDILKDEFDTKPKLVVGGPVHGFENLEISYNDAKYLLDNEKENIHDIVQSFGSESKGKLFLDIYAELKNIMCANIGNTDYVIKVFDTFVKATESYNLSKAMTRRCCFEIASCLYFSYIENSGEAESGQLDSLSKGLIFAGKEESCEVSRMYIEKLLGEDQNAHEIVTKAKHYIDIHLTENLSVSDVAAFLYITPNYFSRLFKRVMKEGCNEYIIRKRIETAKSLLETTSIKTGKIAMMVGYRDTNYFSLAFKKHTGKSPTKYREDMQKP